jgi:selenium metabolism protein YedF
MTHIVDARGLACPEPVIRAKRALESENEIEVLVDNDTAFENVRRLAGSSDCTSSFEKVDGGVYRIFIIKNISRPSVDAALQSGTAAGPTVISITSDRMGRGDDELGLILMKAFVHTLTEVSPAPDTVILYNSGVKLALIEEQSCADLNTLIGRGTEVLVCGTCANHFGIKEQIAAGTISNMYTITETLMKAGRIVCP